MIAKRISALTHLCTPALLTLLLCHLSFSPVRAQKMTISQETVDCGKSAYMVPVTAKFEVKNKSLRRLTITGLQPDCGCTKATVEKKGLGPGEKTTIELTYDGRQLGHYVKQVGVFTNADSKPVYLTMKGVVLAELKDYSGSYPYAMGELLADQNVLEFDDVNQGDEPQQSIHILNNGTTEMTPNVQHLPSYLTAEVMPQKLRPGEQGKVTVTLNSKLIHDFGLTQSSVHLASQLGEKVQSDNEVPVSIVLLPDVKVYTEKNKQFAPKIDLSSESVNLGLINGKKHKRETIVITNKGRLALDISSLRMFTPGLQLTLGKRQLQPGEQTKLKITADREKLLKSKTRPRILMITNDPDKAKIIINVNVK